MSTSEKTIGLLETMPDDKYANPALIEQEEGAFERAIAEK